ncbi:ABC-2 type transport system permease protein [Rhodococcus sp. OK611]|uniref:ABC transporter permease n=1 Tax=unclassified Rhodococcus (in: high G+C Gram-positive bacteria) TaxID=192944 RepID=UPI000BCF67C6|nr:MULTISPECIES: ABC transporter permease [unclassified Rhodococcus (in: high G+C Gram-positive bacteria)]PTR38990.1 ABC-2 type transport system permease protein [Rhodococcus sp. OK611]SNX92776.1 ABC-2 type transport system permease protein [Rhodococcus sp. OK270]
MTTTTPSIERPRIGDQLAALTVRNLRTSARVPQLLMFSLTMPMAMLVLFSQVFRSVAAGPGFPAGTSYIVVFLTPAMLAVSTVMAGTNAGVSAAIDHTNGLHDRFAALPMRAALPGVARTINEAVFTLARAALLGIAAVALGFEFYGTAMDAVAAVVVLVTLAAAMSALFGLIGDRLRRPDVVQFAGMMVMMPLMFISSAFAPLETMPGWMQAMATVNPVAHATDALRGHVLGTATAGDTVAALVAAIGLWVAVTAVPVLIRLIRSPRVR